MGTLCCKQNPEAIDIPSFKTIEDVRSLVYSQLNRVKRRLSDMTTQSTSSDQDEEVKRFYYYNKLEIVLVKVKFNIEGNTNSLAEDTLNTSKPPPVRPVNNTLSDEHSKRVYNYFVELFQTEELLDEEGLLKLEKDMVSRIGTIFIN